MPPSSISRMTSARPLSVSSTLLTTPTLRPALSTRLPFTNWPPLWKCALTVYLSLELRTTTATAMQAMITAARAATRTRIPSFSSVWVSTVSATSPLPQTFRGHPTAPQARRAPVKGTHVPMRTEASAAGHGREDLYLLAQPDLRVQPGEEADVLAGHVDVDETPQAAALADALPQVGVAVEQRVEHLADGGALDLGLRVAAGHGAQLRRD